MQQQMTKDWKVGSRETGDGEVYFIQVPHRESCDCTCPSCSGYKTVYRAHDAGRTYEDESDAWDAIEAIGEAYEEQYERYLEENSHAIAQMERYEMWRQEY